MFWTTGKEKLEKFTQILTVKGSFLFLTFLSALHEGSGDDPQMAEEPTYAKEIRPKKSVAQIGILSQLAELNYPKLG